MKLLLITATAIAVFTVDCRDFSSEPKGRDTAHQAQTIPDENQGKGVVQKFMDGPDGKSITETHDSIFDYTQIKEEENGPHQKKLRGSKCKARNTCVVMGGFCVTNVTLCVGRLMPSGCKGTNCQCCIPGTIEAKFDNLTAELQSFKDYLSSDLQSIKVNMTTSIKQLDSELLSIKIHMNNSDLNLNSKLQALSINTKDMSSNLNSKLSSMNSTLNIKLNTLVQSIGCPVDKGFFKSQGSSQCFKIFTDVKRSWDEARKQCLSHGLLQAEPSNAVAINLRTDIKNKYGSSSHAWLGARYVGSKFVWQIDGREVKKDNPLWYSNHPATYKNCLLLLDYGSTPYAADNSCSGKFYTLCEVRM